MKGECGVELLAIRRIGAYVVIGVSLFLAGFSMGQAVGPPFITHPAWARFRGVGQGAVLVFLMSLGLLPQGHRPRPWLWVGVIGALGYVVLALIARSTYPA